MAALDLGVEEMRKRVTLPPGLTVACINSPQSITISGDNDILDDFLNSMKREEPDILVTKLNVNQAYHSSRSTLHSNNFRRGR